MHENIGQPRALFFSPDGNLHTDYDICSGTLRSPHHPNPCPFSDEGRIPPPHPIGENKSKGEPFLGRLGELAPPCAVEQLGSFAEWQRGMEHCFPAELKPLRVFKCRHMFLLVIPGLRDHQAGEIAGDTLGKTNR